MLKRVTAIIVVLAVALAAREVRCADSSPAPAAKVGESVAAPKAAVPAPTAEPGSKAAADEEWKAKYQKALERRITFEFVDTPFVDCVEFLRTVANVNLVLDQALLHQPATTVSLRVQDMPISDALSWLTRLAGAEWELRDQAVHIQPGKDAAQPKAGPQPGRTEEAARDAGGARPAGRLRVRLANGAEVEADQGALAQFPGLTERMLEEFFDSSKDGVLCYRALPPGRSLEDLRELCALIAPKARLQMAQNLLLVSGDDARELRRVAALMRQLLLAQRKDAPTTEKDRRP